MFFFLMVRRPPISTHTDTPFPNSTPFRSPGRARSEDIAIDAFDRDRDREAQIGVDTELRLLKLARQRGIEQCAGHLDRHARAGAMLAAGPARVDQPTIDPTPGNTPAQKIIVEAGMARHAGGATARDRTSTRTNSRHKD